MSITQQIIALFWAAGISNPSINQIEKTRTLVVGNFDNSPEILKTWIKTAEDIRRWRDFPEMSIIDTVWSHQRRVAKMVNTSQKAIISTLPEFDFKKTRFMAEYHDMSEGLSPLWDIPTPQKNAMSSDLRELLDKVEVSCIKILSTLSHPEFDQKSSSIEAMLQEMHDKKTPEAQLVKYFDLLDGFFISIYEFNCWNVWFMTPLEYYMDVFDKINQWAYLPIVREITLTINNKTKNTFFDISWFPQQSTDIRTYELSRPYTLWKDQIFI